MRNAEDYLLSYHYWQSTALQPFLPSDHTYHRLVFEEERMMGLHDLERILNTVVLCLNISFAPDICFHSILKRASTTSSEAMKSVGTWGYYFQENMNNLPIRRHFVLSPATLPERHFFVLQNRASL
jgi:hypothetical protein